MAAVCHEYKLSPAQFYGLRAEELGAMVERIEQVHKERHQALQALAGATGLTEQ